MKNNRLAYILIVILMAWLAILSNDLKNTKKANTSNIINEYEVNGISTDFTKVIDQVKPGVVTANADGTILSGFVYRQNDDEVYIVTAYHGVSNSNTISVIFGSSYSAVAELLGHDLYTDLAVLRVNSPYIIEPMKLGDTTLLKQGEFVFSIGTPVSLDYAGSVELGMVSSANLVLENTISVEEERYNYYLNVIQLSSQLAAGYSGSPVINMNGEVIGINTMALNSNTSFAITVNEVRRVADTIINNEELTHNYLGIKGKFIKDMYNYEKSNLNVSLDTIDGLYAARVRDNSIAYAAGIRSGDIISSVNGIEIRGLNDYLDILYMKADTFTFEYIRNGESATAEVTNND